MLQLPEGIVPEVRPLALEMGIHNDCTPVHLLAALILRRNDIVMLILEDARVDVGRMRLELEERIAEGRIEKPDASKGSLKFILNQGVLIAQRYSMKKPGGDAMAASIVENHPNAASRVLMERGVSMDVAKRWVRNELTGESGKEAPEVLMRRIARRLEVRTRVRFPAVLLNRLTVLAAQYLEAAGANRAETLKLLIQTIAAETMTSKMPEALRELHLGFTDAKRRAAEAQKIGRTSTKRRSLMEELRSRENYLRSLADWLERQPPMDVSDETVRGSIASVGNLPIKSVSL